MARIENLERKGYTVYTMSMPVGCRGGCRHFPCKVGTRGAKEICTRMDAGVQFRYICMDFIRFPTIYFDGVFLKHKIPGTPLLQLLQILFKHKRLHPDVEVLVPNRQSQDFVDAMRLLVNKKFSVTLTQPTRSPLYTASVEEKQVCGGYDPLECLINLAPSGKMCRISLK